MDQNYILVIGFLSALWIGFLVIIRNIQFFFPPWEDMNKMINTAAKANEWHWPSRMHRPDNRSTYMKDTTMLMLVVFQRIFRDTKNMFPAIAMQSFANIASAFIIFLIANIYWSTPIAWIMAIVFVVSFWPWQIALNVGHVNIATMFFLLGVYTSILSGLSAGLESSLWMILTGCIFTALVFSSASWVKYVLLFFAALIFSSNYSVLSSGDWPSFFSVFSPDKYLWPNIIVALVVITIVVLINLVRPKIVALMYEGRLPTVLKKIMTILKRDMAGKQDFNLDHYQDYAKKKLKLYGSWLLRAYFLLFMVLNFVGLADTLLFIVGLLVVFLILTLPDIKKSLSFYWLYVRENQIRQKTAFRPWAEYFAKRGIYVDRHTRSGFRWVPKAFFKMTPFLTIFFYLSFIYLLAMDLGTRQYWSSFSLLITTGIALLPIIWGEITSSPTSTRNYFAGFVGLLVFVGYSLNRMYQSFPDAFFTFALTILSAYMVWNLYNFFTDVLPARMTINNLVTKLDKLNIKEFYTYQTDFNGVLVDAFRPHITDKYTIKYINSINEVAGGWVVIPATSQKTTPIPTDEIVATGDFVQDPVLNSLLSSKRIGQIATARFKTFGASKFWIQDNEVISYHDLILHDITPADHLRSYAWLINARDIPRNN